MQGDDDNSDTNGQSRNYSDSPININKKVLKDSRDLININKESRKFSDSDEGRAMIDLGIVENWRTLKLLGRISAGDVMETRRRLQAIGHDLRDTGYIVRVLEGMAEKNDHDGGARERNYADWAA